MISSLNYDKKLPADRLLPVRERNEYGKVGKEDDNATSSTISAGVCLHDDYAYSPGDNYKIGRVQRMVHNGKHGRQDYRRPLAYGSRFISNNCIWFSKM